MTRINLIPVNELSDQHLMAEYRELPRIVNGVLEGKFRTDNKIPPHYVLGAGHVKFCTNKLMFLQNRYQKIHSELLHRKFQLNPNFSPTDMFNRIKISGIIDKKHQFSSDEVALSRNRIIEKIMQKPNWYKWTDRKKPTYLQ